MKFGVNTFSVKCLMHFSATLENIGLDWIGWDKYESGFLFLWPLVSSDTVRFFVCGWMDG